MSNDTHPALPEFEYYRPQSLAEASDFLSSHPGIARPFLGGTDIFVRMRDGFLHPEFLVDVKHLEDLDKLVFDQEDGLTIGAAVSMNQVIASPHVKAHYALLAEACQSVASYQLRNRATITGNICNASPAGDTIGACLLFDGVLHIHGVNGRRQEALSSFFLAPGKTTLKPGDIVTALHLPAPRAGCQGTYLKLGRNKLSDLSIVAVTVLAFPSADHSSGYRFRLALTSVAPVPLLVPGVEALLASEPVTHETLNSAAELAAAACSPIDDVRGSARYRRQMVRNLSLQALESVWSNLQ